MVYRDRAVEASVCLVWVVGVASVCQGKVGASEIPEALVCPDEAEVAEAGASVCPVWAAEVVWVY